MKEIVIILLHIMVISLSLILLISFIYGIIKVIQFIIEEFKEHKLRAVLESLFLLFTISFVLLHLIAMFVAGKGVE